MGLFNFIRSTYVYYLCLILINLPSAIPTLGEPKDRGKEARHQGVLTWQDKVASSRGICSRTPIGGSGLVVWALAFMAGVLAV